MARRRGTKKEIVTDADHPEGFAPQKYEDVRGPRPVPSDVRDNQLAKRAPITIYKKDSDVPPELRRHVPPEPPKQNPHAPSVKEQATAIEALLAKTVERRKQDALKRIKDPYNHEIIAAIGEATAKLRGGRDPYVKPVKVEEETTDDSGQEETRPEA